MAILIHLFFAALSLAFWWYKTRLETLRDVVIAALLFFTGPIGFIAVCIYAIFDDYEDVSKVKMPWAKKD